VRGRYVLLAEEGELLKVDADGGNKVVEGELLAMVRELVDSRED